MNETKIYNILYRGGGSIQQGSINIHVMDMKNQPIPDAVVTIHKIDEDGNPTFVTIVNTGKDGKTNNIMLDSPPIACSYDYEQRICPYATYHIEITKSKYDIEAFSGIQIFSSCYSSLAVHLHYCYPDDSNRNITNFDHHKLYRLGEIKCLK